MSLFDDFIFMDDSQESSHGFLHSTSLPDSLDTASTSTDLLDSFSNTASSSAHSSNQDLFTSTMNLNSPSSDISYHEFDKVIPMDFGADGPSHNSDLIEDLKFDFLPSNANSNPSTESVAMTSLTSDQEDLINTIYNSSNDQLYLSNLDQSHLSSLNPFDFSSSTSSSNTTTSASIMSNSNDIMGIYPSPVASSNESSSYDSSPTLSPSATGNSLAASFDIKNSSRISLPKLYALMNLSHNPDLANQRINTILQLLEAQGFLLTKQTWIRDTTKQQRQRIIRHIRDTTFAEFGYTEELIEIVIKRNSYYLMQGKLRKIRRRKKKMENQEKKKKLILSSSTTTTTATPAMSEAILVG